MKKFFLTIFLLLIPAYWCADLYSWGFFAHKKINRMAVLTLPDGMIGFYKKHLNYISEHAVDPDKRRYANVDEAARHYIDLDHYGKDAMTEVPQRWMDAVKKYSEDTLKAYGIVPWHIDVMMHRLQKAFTNLDLDLILHYSADIGHYIADAHVPLHTTENYNGQLTNQKGIHGFWESRIPEIKSDEYDYFTGKAIYIEKVLPYAWSFVYTSHLAVDSVLSFEAQLNNVFPPDRKYATENRGNMITKVYSEEYTNAYNDKLNGMVERRMRQAILAVGSLWMTAWLNAGQPDLNKIGSRELSDSLKAVQAAEEILWKTGKPAGSVKGHDD